MKKFIPILFLIFLFACEDDFYKEVNKYLLVETDAEKNDLINGIYSRLVAVHNSNYFKLFSRSDDVNLYSSYTFSSEGKTQCSSSGGGAIDYIGIANGIYQNLYVAIINVNSLLKTLSENEDKALVGELYFLRAYSYFKLARFFGTPPLVVDVDVDYTLDKPSYAEVYQLVENDLIKAIELLPDTYTDARVPNETPHKGTAKALLAEVYLTMAGYPLNDTAKYAEAARLSGEVIEKADYYNFSLLPDLASLWEEKNRHNSENIFGLFFGESSDAVVNSIGSSYLGNWVIGSSYHPELKFYYNFPDNYRRKVSLVEGYYTSLNYETEDTSFSILKYCWYNPVKILVVLFRVVFTKNG
ncbi:MAG TPA: RagB/SusD family nutrient uptake outer membrane protein [Prolixibacteraceae bacterium]|nr:RagB/SusD family nutrient uptake outer membrane protein [Prolixibacteraceae bacterium]